jgi:imidazoleglycerol-phosphate dehydratase
MRVAEINRKTNETDISLSLCLDGGAYEISTGVGFLDHMLTLFAKHGNFGLKVNAVGDTHIDAHHTVEDVAICLGRAMREAAGDCRGICRYGDITLPMDDALMLCAVDFGGRAYLGFAVDIPAVCIGGNFDTELFEEFLAAFVREAGCNLHMRKLAGTNSHHIIEGGFKALARALRKALAIDPTAADALPTTKGVL